MRNERLHVLSNRPQPKGSSWILYWMQASVRVDDNLALEFAARESVVRGLPLVVFFGITSVYPGATARHYRFLIDGLIDVGEELERRGVCFLVRSGPPLEAALELGKRAALTVVDTGYTRILAQWRRDLGKRATGPVLMVEDNVCVPVGSVYPKSAVGARVLRPRIELAREEFLNDGIGFPSNLPSASDPGGERLSATELDSYLSVTPGIPGATEQLRDRKGGYHAGMSVFDQFMESGLHRYEDERNDPNKNAVSLISPYLHFGQVSVRELARRVITQGGPGASSYLEELLVRRELGMNFVYYHPNYDSPDVLPGWAISSLDAHSSDTRPALYSDDEMEEGRTDDPYWNACQKQMVYTGHMHGYMRMYWGKKVIEWCSDWRRAWTLLLYWNDKYELDGRDPNGYAGVAWCFGMHDRPWKDREIFGVVRYMNARGLKRKFDVEAYVKAVESDIKEDYA